MQQAKVDAYVAVTENTAKPEEAEQRAIDVIDRSIGACKERMKKEFWYIINPLYWIFACFRVVRDPFKAIVDESGEKDSNVAELLHFMASSD